MQISITDIAIPARKRPLNVAYVAQLAESIRQVGMLHPITVTPAHVLISGRHRIEAIRHLGKPMITAEVTALDTLNVELAEIDENLIRNELTVLERGEHLQRCKVIYEALHPDTRNANIRGGPGRGHKMDADTAPVLSFAAQAATVMGSSKRAVQVDLQIAEKVADDVKDAIRATPLADEKTELLALSRLPPEQQRVTVHSIMAGESKNVKQAVYTQRRDAQVEQIQRTVLPTGKYRIIVADPPWAYAYRAADTSHRAANPYPTMAVSAICAMPVASLAYDDAILWLWTTNAFMRDAYAVADAWGFTVKTILTWAKNRMGLGDWLRGQTEHCLLCVKGKPVVTLTSQTTLLHGPMREHSRKPDEFYALVDSLCPGNKCELFSREQREGWDNFGAELDKF